MLESARQCDVDTTPRILGLKMTGESLSPYRLDWVIEVEVVCMSVHLRCRQLAAPVAPLGYPKSRHRLWRKPEVGTTI